VDFDTLARRKKARLGLQGRQCLRQVGKPGASIAVSICSGLAAKDAGREPGNFDLATKTLSRTGFVTTEAAGCRWVENADTIADIASDWGGGYDDRVRGYPFIVKGGIAGTPLEAVRGGDRGAPTQRWRLARWHGTVRRRVLQGAVKSETFFTHSIGRLPDGEAATRCAGRSPESSPNGIYKASFAGVARGRLGTGRTSRLVQSRATWVRLRRGCISWKRRELPEVSPVFHPDGDTGG